jgi:hypothetical protein
VAITGVAAVFIVPVVNVVAIEKGCVFVCCVIVCRRLVITVTFTVARTGGYHGRGGRGGRSRRSRSRSRSCRSSDH